MISLIRYPGSKAKLARQIVKRFPSAITAGTLWTSGGSWEYREPFFGGGAVGLEFMGWLGGACPIWVNDIDPSMAALWRTMYAGPDDFMRLCEKFTPTTESFYEFKETDGMDGLSDAEAAFRKVALHRISFSGFGAKAGGPIGGREQTSEYGVDCRWSIEHIRKESKKAHTLMRKFSSMKITCGDFEPLIATANERTFIYLDPPYYEKGGQLYKHNMSDADHTRLRDLLLDTPATWMLSYDDHPRIRELYAGMVIEPINVTYTNAIKNGGSRPKNQEVLIFPQPS